jgi:AcrR family transcriptional regulator
VPLKVSTDTDGLGRTERLPKGRWGRTRNRRSVQPPFAHAGARIGGLLVAAAGRPVSHNAPRHLTAEVPSSAGCVALQNLHRDRVCITSVMYNAAVGRKPNPERKPELLRAVVAELARSGLAGVSLRPLAQALGVSTYTLSYHFGSKEQLLVEALAHVEEEQRRLVAGWTAELGPEADAAAVIERYWTWVSRPENLGQVRLVFEVLTSPQGAELIPAEDRRRLMSAWVELIAGELQAHGVPKRVAMTEATIAASALAGMVLDLLATGDQRRLRAAARTLGERLVSTRDALDPEGCILPSRSLS